MRANFYDPKTRKKEISKKSAINAYGFVVYSTQHLSFMPIKKALSEFVQENTFLSLSLSLSYSSIRNKFMKQLENSKHMYSYICTKQKKIHQWLEAKTERCTAIYYLFHPNTMWILHQQCLEKRKHSQSTECHVF